MSTWSVVIMISTSMGTYELLQTDNWHSNWKSTKLEPIQLVLINHDLAWEIHGQLLLANISAPNYIGIEKKGLKLINVNMLKRNSILPSRQIKYCICFIVELRIKSHVLTLDLLKYSRRFMHFEGKTLSSIRITWRHETNKECAKWFKHHFSD